MFCVLLRVVLRSGNPEGLRPDHQPDPGRESRARVQLHSGCGAGGAGTLHRPRRQRVSPSDPFIISIYRAVTCKCISDIQTFT